MELLTVEAVGKFGPKANGKWYGVKKPLGPNDFKKGETYEVETENWKSGEKTGMNIVTAKPHAQTQAKTTVVTKNKDVAAPVLNYEDSKNKRILIQGIVQAVAQAPALVQLTITNVDEYTNLVKEAAKQLIDFVNEETR